MLEILYRIYQVPSSNEKEIEHRRGIDFGVYSSSSKEDNIELVMDCCLCDSREQFKDIIRAEYGEDIPFRYSKGYKEGQLYCIIIGEHCYDIARYFDKITFTCTECGCTVTTYRKKSIKIDNWDLEHKFFNKEGYADKQFCSQKCLCSFVDRESAKIHPDGESEFWVTRDMFTNNKLSGYIYKITKKSTGEFYVGQTMYAPVFRWGQHLKTERFTIDNILDYQFETIELVPKGGDILEREKYWIQKCYLECPEKSLNIMQTANIQEK